MLTISVKSWIKAIYLLGRGKRRLFLLSLYNHVHATEGGNTFDYLFQLKNHHINDDSADDDDDEDDDDFGYGDDDKDDDDDDDDDNDDDNNNDADYLDNDDGCNNICYDSRNDDYGGNERDRGGVYDTDDKIIDRGLMLYAISILLHLALSIL